VRKIEEELHEHKRGEIVFEDPEKKNSRNQCAWLSKGRKGTFEVCRVRQRAVVLRQELPTDPVLEKHSL
jgi:hypothetical protein